MCVVTVEFSQRPAPRAPWPRRMRAADRMFSSALLTYLEKKSADGPSASRALKAQLNLSSIVQYRHGSSCTDLNLHQTANRNPTRGVLRASPAGWVQLRERRRVFNRRSRASGGQAHFLNTSQAVEVSGFVLDVPFGERAAFRLLLMTLPASGASSGTGSSLVVWKEKRMARCRILSCGRPRRSLPTITWSSRTRALPSAPSSLTSAEQMAPLPPPPLASWSYSWTRSIGGRGEPLGSLSSSRRSSHGCEAPLSALAAGSRALGGGSSFTSRTTKRTYGPQARSSRPALLGDE